MDDGNQVIASWHCEQCEDNLCDQCKDAHRLVRITKNHVLSEIENVAELNLSVNNNEEEPGNAELNLSINNNEVEASDTEPEETEADVNISASELGLLSKSNYIENFRHINAKNLQSINFDDLDTSLDEDWTMENSNVRPEASSPPLIRKSLQRSKPSSPPLMRESLPRSEPSTPPLIREPLPRSEPSSTLSLIRKPQDVSPLIQKEKNVKNLQQKVSCEECNKLLNIKSMKAHLRLHEKKRELASAPPPPAKRKRKLVPAPSDCIPPPKKNKKTLSQ